MFIVSLSQYKVPNFISEVLMKIVIFTKEDIPETPKNWITKKVYNSFV